MKTFINILVLFVLLLSVANAASTGFITVKEVRAEGGNIYVYPNEAISNPLNCDREIPIILDPSDTDFEHMYEQAIVALTTGIRMQFFIGNCASSPWGNTRPLGYASGIYSN